MPSYNISSLVGYIKFKSIDNPISIKIQGENILDNPFSIKHKEEIYYIIPLASKYREEIY